MNIIDQAFWQLFHAVDATLADDAVLNSLPRAHEEGVVELEFKAPPHAMGILRREAERRGLAYSALIAALSEERAHELPAWWMALARSQAVGIMGIPAIKPASLVL